jgi:hypothetical protein
MNRGADLDLFPERPAPPPLYLTLVIVLTILLRPTLSGRAFMVAAMWQQ